MFSGVIPALLTPLSDRDLVDTGTLRDLVEFLLSRGVDGFYACGSTGEGLLMTERERCQVVDTVIDQVRGRVPVIVHVGAPATSVSERLARHAREAGADAVASIPPIYYAVGRVEIETHYRRIAEASGLPLYLYNIPNATQVNLEGRLICDLVKGGIARGLKYTSYDLLNFREVIEFCGSTINVLAGPDEMLLPFLVMGAHGGIGTTYNLVPELFVDLYAAWTAGDLEKAQQIQYQIDRIILVIRKFAVIPAVKAALHLRGIDCGGPRAPLLPLSPQAMEQLAGELEQEGVLALGRA
ncbi:MAG: dihydrodipicolinate synthase family protein [Anaerolineae bacterium]